MADAGDITTTTGQVTFGASRTGSLSTSGDVTTSGGDVKFSRSMVLGKHVAIDTGMTEGAISFSGGVDGDYLLSLTAGTGSIKFDGAAGGTTPLSGLKVVSAGSLGFDSALSVDDEGLDITSATVDINGAVTTKNGGTAKIVNSDLLTIASAGDMNLDGKFTQDGEGSVSIAGDITTSSDDISFASGVTLSGGINLLSLIHI